MFYIKNDIFDYAAIENCSRTLRRVLPTDVTLIGVKFLKLKFEYLCENEFFSKTILSC